MEIEVELNGNKKQRKPLKTQKLKALQIAKVVK